MCLLFVFGFLSLIPFFAKREYLLTAMGEAAFMLPVAIGIKQLKNTSLKTLFGKGSSISLLPILILLPFCMQTFVAYMTLPLHTLLYEVFGDVGAEIDNAGSAGELAAQIVSICVLPAVTEELLCRGVVTEMMKPYGEVAAMLTSALAFAMLHFSAYSFPVIFMMGILLSMVRLLTGSLGACMVVHFSNNLFSLLSGYIPEDGAVLQGIITVGAFALFPVLIMRFLKKAGPERISLGGSKKITFSPMLCVCATVFAFVTIAGIFI